MSIDREGVGELMRIGVERGRKTRKDLKVGICGEHGGDPASVAFCHEVGLDYVSCSPFRVPIARLAAAQAALGKDAASQASMEHCDPAIRPRPRKSRTCDPACTPGIPAAFAGSHASVRPQSLGAPRKRV